ncbi:putative phosphoglycerate mutase pmu1 [Vanrija albida]|uniref:Phosphoglycerate mutase pmu1 n=1 Tax=Vanrija albida TaxID=181172 RepID=A0ABR3PUE7_9TREE
MLATLLTVLALSAPLAASSPLDAVADIAARSKHDKFHGKTLAPSNYTVVPGVFVQDDPKFNATGYDLLSDSFGLLDKSAKRWKNFTKYVTDLNKRADEHTTYKVVYIARHGQGYHNAAESFYGTPAWNCYWAQQKGDGNITWADAELTPLGIAQAQACNDGWKTQLKDGIPLPQRLYSSPMRRSASTLEITWKDILLNKGVKPVIQERWRESIGLHTCDWRNNKSDIATRYPGFEFEPSFTEHDLLWDDTYEETGTQQAKRIRNALNEIFATDPSTFISITAHSGVINAFFKATGHNAFSVQTGGFVPVLLKAVSYPSATFSPIVGGQSATAPSCTADPTVLVKAPATVTVQPTWYPACATVTTTASPSPTGCLASPVTGPAPTATKSA